MLKLVAETDPRWGSWAASRLDEILVDHAHCEKKAAGAAMNLLFRYPHVRHLQEPLAALAQEELGHFEAVLGELRRVEIDFVPQKPGPYGGKLHRFVRDPEPDRLIDTLLCCAVIEARSCERLQLLAAALEDPDLKRLYEDLLAAEARHHRVYVELAREVADEGVSERLEAACAHEARVLKEAPDLARLHAGAGFIL